MKKLFLQVLLCVWSLHLLAVEQPITDKVEEYLQAAGKVLGFSGSVLISIKNEPIYVNGIGKASYQLNVPNDSRNAFRIGALTKQFTAAAALKLAQKGLVELKAPIGKYLEDYPAQTANKITVHDLLAHTSGIPDYTNDPKYIKDRSQGDLVPLFANLPLQFEPGTKFDYSNSNYVLLGRIIAAVSGIPYEAYIIQQIINPLELKSTGFFTQADIIPHMSYGYSFGANNQLINAACYDNPGGHAADGMYATIGDLFVWSQALLTDKVIGPYMGKLMLTPYKGNYGYGWRIDGPKVVTSDQSVKNMGKLHYWHEGETEGYLSLISIFPEQKISIILLSNNDLAQKNTQSINTIHNALASIVFNLPYAVPTESVLYHP